MAVTNTQQSEFTCPECGGNLKKDTGETYCLSCGLVVEEDLTNQKKPFQNKHFTEESARLDSYSSGSGRSDTSNDMHDKDLGSELSWKNKDASGDRVPEGMERVYDRMRMHQKTWQFSKKEQNNRQGLGEIRRMLSAMDLDKSVLPIASEIFNKAHEADLTVGRSIDAVADVSVFIAARMTNNIRDADVWIDRAAVDKRKFDTTKRILLSELGIGYTPSTPSDYVDTVLDEFSVSDTTRKQIIELVKEIEENQIHTGKRPRGVVGAAIYLTKDYITQEQVGDKIDISTATIGKHSREIQKELDL